MSPPLVSVITPTWQRHDQLLSRCIPSVSGQFWPVFEHIVVSDGPDNDLYDILKSSGHERLRYAEVKTHDNTARWGHWARLAGIEMAKGEIIAYLDDDNAYRPRHLWLLVRALMDNPGVGFAYPRTAMHVFGNDYEIGTDPPRYGHIDTSGIVHWRTVFEHGTWEPSLPTIDWDLVDRWMKAGVTWKYVHEVTVDYYK
jgi:glycosyltransferase involved in cell wall biosynthesis